MNNIKKIIFHSLSIIILVSCKTNRNDQYFINRKPETTISIAYLDNNENKNIIGVSTNGYIQYMKRHIGENGEIFSHYFFDTNGIFMQEYCESDSMICGDFYDFYPNRIIQTYAYYDSFGQKAFVREYDEFGKLLKSEGVALDVGISGKDSLFYMKLAEIPYSKIQLKYWECDNKNKRLTDTFYCENMRTIFHKPKSYLNRIYVYIKIIDYSENDTILGKYRIKLPILLSWYK